MPLSSSTIIAVALDEHSERIGFLSSEPLENSFQMKLSWVQLRRQFLPLQRGGNSCLWHRAEDVGRNCMVTARILHNVDVYFPLSFVLASFDGCDVREISHSPLSDVHRPTSRFVVVAVLLPRDQYMQTTF